MTKYRDMNDLWEMKETTDGGEGGNSNVAAV